MKGGDILETIERDEYELVRRFSLLITRIVQSYIDGYSSIKILYELIDIQKQQPEKFITRYSFFTHLYGISYQSAVLNLSNILINNKDSVNIHK